MAIKIGNTDISAFKVGSGDCKVYLGDTLLYPTTPSFDGKFKATYSDSRIYSAACDSSTELTTATTKPSGYQYAAMTSAEIGDCVTSIEERAFTYCTSLTSIDIPDNVTSIGGWAFAWCSGLTSIDIPDSITSIDDYAFFDCNSLATCTIGSGVTSIGMQCLYGCTGLTSITVLATTPPTLGFSAFDNTNDCPIYVPSASVNAYKTAWRDYASRIQCVEPSFDGKWLATYSDSHTESAACDSTSAITRGEIASTDLVDVQIGQCVTSIGNSAFNGCRSLTSITIPNSVTSIGNSAFISCGSLTGVTIPNSVTSIGGSAFQNCNSLSSITIPSSVTSIGDVAFAQCNSLTDIDIPSGVTSIGDRAFGYCSGLTSCTIGSGVTSIGIRAFYKCSGMTSVTVNATTPPTLGDYAFDDTNNCPIYVPSESLNDYNTAWSNYASRLTPKP